MSHLNINGVDKPLDHIYVNTGSAVKEAWEARTRVILHGLTNPLCGVGTYKDTLDLSTGTLTRYVKKLVLTGNENWNMRTDDTHIFYMIVSGMRSFGQCMSSHYKFVTKSIPADLNSGEITTYLGQGVAIWTKNDGIETVNDYKYWLSQQYANGTPVTVWYILATPETEQITLPSNLTGIVEGHLAQTGTPTPTNPIYPTANGTLEQGGTYSLDTGAYAIAWGRADTFTGTNSISARCYGLPVKSWEIDGNSQQSGVPSPDNVIMPTFCGVRTANLVEKRIDGCNISSNGSLNSNASWNTFVAKIEQGKTYSVDAPSYSAFYELTPIIGSSSYDGQRYAIESSFTSPIDGYVAFRKMASELTAMCNEGSTPLPYEPYGWAEKITCAGQTVPVYLGEVQTVRRIMKYEFTGQETITLRADFDNATAYTYTHDAFETVPYGTAPVICSHFPFLASFGDQSDHIYQTAPNFYITSTQYRTVADFKSFLAQQYAAGNPVTVWCVLAEPETAIVNEPLAKIGTYADTLTSDQAGITIQTTDGNNTISVDTTLSPSKFEVKVHAKPI